MTKTFYWHDYETFGIIPGKDRASQFAGIRTDEDLNIIGKPLVTYCRPANDFLPQPEACLVTGITPQKALSDGLPEYQFFQQINAELSLANTCTVGYNSLRFDDEFTRFGFYRNFIDPYAREWQNGNSRWDIIDVARLTAALRPEGINWPINEKGRISFRLELLTQANGIKHQDAHDALSDVYATIEFAKLIKLKQPRLYHFCLQLNNKHKVLEQLQLSNPKPLLHVSGMISGEYGHTTLIIPIMMHPDNNNAVIVCDLRDDPTELLALSAEEISYRLYTSTPKLEEKGLKRLHLKSVHINKCPIIAPLSTLSPDSAEKLQINIKQQCSHAKSLINNQALKDKLIVVFSRDYSNDKSIKSDVDNMLYSGGFFTSQDRYKMDAITLANEQSILSLDYQFQDPRLEEMLFRYKARNFEHLLSKEDKVKWDEFRLERMTNEKSNASIYYKQYIKTIDALIIEQVDVSKIELLQTLKKYPKLIGLTDKI